MHWKTREAINAKRRSDYREKTKTKKITRQVDTSKSIQCGASNNQCDNSSMALEDVEERTPEAQRKALQRARSALTQSPRKFFNTVQTLIDKSSSPRKRKLFVKSSDPTTHQFGRLFLGARHRLRDKNTKADRVKRRELIDLCNLGYSGSSSQTASLIGVNRKTLLRHKMKGKFRMRRLAKRSQKDAADKLAEEYFEDVATTLPDKKLVSKKTGKAAAVLKHPLKDSHKKFCEKFGAPMSFTRFTKCRPRHIRKIAQARLRQCLCEYCENTLLKLTTLNAIASVHDNACRIRHEFHAVDLITCDSKNKDCCCGACGQCGIHLLNNHIGPLLLHRGELTWHRWEAKKVLFKGKEVSRKALVTKRGDIDSLLAELKKEVVFLAEHLFRANWQNRQFSLVRSVSPFPAQSVCMVLDFAENFTCNYQQEVQAAHWHHEQVTVHPIVAYYRCPVCPKTVSSCHLIDGMITTPFIISPNRPWCI
ncbi:hypothetical protein V1264_010549 [Littorina saxatilis]|uniref:Uncharacterized protein n=1 Tax=Littorina saxatilis TaxID=31220 RepID=A0AAN9G0M8_9CAEN